MVQNLFELLGFHFHTLTCTVVPINGSTQRQRKADEKIKMHWYLPANGTDTDYHYFLLLDGTQKEDFYSHIIDTIHCIHFHSQNGSICILIAQRVHNYYDCTSVWVCDVYT